MFSILLVAAIWCSDHGNKKDIQECRDRMMKCLKDATKIVPAPENAIYTCGDKEKIKT